MQLFYLIVCKIIFDILYELEEAIDLSFFPPLSKENTICVFFLQMDFVLLASLIIDSIAY